MSRINKGAQEVIKIIKQAVDNPHWDQKKVVESMKEYYRLLDVPMPKIKVAKNMVLAYKICTGAARDAARGAAGDAAWDAARGAARDATWDAAAINTGLKDPATIKFIQIETKLLEALENGLGWFFPMRDQLVIVPFPELKLDEQERLHSENSKAVIWPDKTGFYFWHGTKVNEKIIKTPSKITKKDILKEQNAEVRRCIREKLGDEKFAKRLGIEQIHKGQRGILYRTKDKDDLKDDYLYFVKVVCPTTKRVYFLGVPEFGDADSAVAWTFGKKKSNYDPKVEA